MTQQKRDVTMKQIFYKKIVCTIALSIALSSTPNTHTMMIPQTLCENLPQTPLLNSISSIINQQTLTFPILPIAALVIAYASGLAWYKITTKEAHVQQINYCNAKNEIHD